MSVHLGVSMKKGGTRELVRPALIEHAKERRESVEDRIADRIRAFSGSMQFV
jgi:uncharacterized membrane protein